MQAEVWKLKRMVEENGGITPELARLIAACKFEPDEIERYRELLATGSQRPLNDAEHGELEELLTANQALVLLVLQARKFAIT